MRLISGASSLSMFFYNQTSCIPDIYGNYLKIFLPFSIKIPFEAFSTLRPCKS